MVLCCKFIVFLYISFTNSMYRMEHIYKEMSNKVKVCKKRKTVVQTPEEIWDEKCQQAIVLFNQGIAYPDIAKKVGCHVSNLYRELKKRGLFQFPK
ncbi:MULTISPECIES: helix-turn-helix domain-containing protein [Bacillus cereus group]|uniref:helix-turn-helix domain-containing protein n=1 Tax=Bacillus cereus group TaxID=86661 RepID=UPI00080BC988